MKINRILFIAIALIIAIPAIVFLFSKDNIKPPIKTSEPTPTQTIRLCEQFENASYPVSCQKAVERALLDTKGNIKNITIGSRRFQDNLQKEMWRIDIKLERPFTAPNGNEVKSLRIEIPTDGTNAIFRVPIKS